MNVVDVGDGRGHCLVAIAIARNSMRGDQQWVEIALGARASTVTTTRPQATMFER